MVNRHKNKGENPQIDPDFRRILGLVLQEMVNGKGMLAAYRLRLLKGGCMLARELGVSFIYGYTLLVLLDVQVQSTCDLSSHNADQAEDDASATFGALGQIALDE